MNILTADSCSRGENVKLNWVKMVICFCHGDTVPWTEMFSFNLKFFHEIWV